MECLGPRRGGHDALDVAVTSSSAACAGRRTRADLRAARRFAFRGILPVRHRIVHKLGEARLVDVGRQLAARSYFRAVLSSTDVFAKGNESFPSGKSAPSYKLLVISHGPIDARTTAAVCAERLDEVEGNARPAPAVLNCFVAALPAARPAPDNGDDAVDGDEGGLLIAQPAALLRVEPCPAAGAMRSYQRRTRRRLTAAKTMLTFHRLCVGNLFVENLMEVVSSFELIARSMPSAASTCHSKWACNNSVISLACTIWVLGCAFSQMLLGSCVSRRSKRIFQWSSDETMSSCDCAILDVQCSTLVAWLILVIRFFKQCSRQDDYRCSSHK